jgi:hypothetical protein
MQVPAPPAASCRRTAKEIEDEATALRVLRGDFAFAGKEASPEELVDRMVRNKLAQNAFVGEGPNIQAERKEE